MAEIVKHSRKSSPLEPTTEKKKIYEKEIKITKINANM
jgi:hypothetical protein